MVGKFFPNWEKMTVREIRAYLRRRRSVIQPIGVIEQHGYHLPLTTDVLTAQGISLRVGERTGTLVAPPITTSFSGGQLPGTINISPNVMGLVVADTVRSLAEQGFQNVFLVLGHAGSENLMALTTSLNLFLREHPQPPMLVLAPIWKYSPRWEKAFKLGDWHAGWIETSLIMALAPELVQMDQLRTDRPALHREMRKHPDMYQFAQKPVEDDSVIPLMAQRPEIQVGVMGDPARASAGLGKKVLAEIVQNMCTSFKKIEKRRSPAYRKVPWKPAPIVL